MAHILIVGKSFSGLKNYLIDNGHSFTVLQDMRTTKFPDKKFKNRVVADFGSYENLFKSVDNIQQERPIDGLLTTYENYILDAAHIAKHLGLPGISTEAAADRKSVV